MQDRFLSALVLCVLFLACQTDKPVQVTPVEPVVEVPQPTPTPTEPAKPAGFEVSKEKYQTTFTQIEDLIAKLNKIIQGRQYDAWKTYLDGNYIKAMSDPQTLKTYNDSPILKKYSIKIKNLNDYFEYVVVPSRSNAKLDEILFLDENRVIAYMYIKTEKTILYQLQFDGNTWKISHW